MIAKDVSQSRMFHRCHNPQRIVKRDGRVIYVPCRKCSACLNYRSWRLSNRCIREYRNPDYMYPVFVTFTYDNDSIPVFIRRMWLDEETGEIKYSPFYINPKNGALIPVAYMDMEHLPFQIENYDVQSRYSEIEVADYFAAFDVRDLQLCFKRLRKRIADNIAIKKDAFRYFFVSEYGGCRHRPHYHGIFYCKSKEVQEFLLNEFDSKSRTSDPFWRWSAGLRSSWALGITDASVPNAVDGVGKYVAGYITSLSQLSSNFNLRALRPFYICSKNHLVGLDVSEIRDFERMQSDFVNNKIPSPTPVRCSFSADGSTVKNVLYTSYIGYKFVPKIRSFDKLAFEERVKIYSSIYVYLVQKGYIKNNRLVSDCMCFDAVKREVSKRFAINCFNTELGLVERRFINPAPSFRILAEDKRTLTPADWHCCWCAVDFVLRYPSKSIFDYVNFVTDYYTSAYSFQIGEQIKQYNYCYRSKCDGHELDYYLYSDLDLRDRLLHCDSEAIYLAKSLGIVLSERTMRKLVNNELCPEIESERNQYLEQEEFYANIRSKVRYANEKLRDVLPDTTIFTDVR